MRSQREGITLPAVGQVGIVVKDVHKTIEYYQRVLGIGPWQIRDRYLPEAISRGKVSPVRATIGIASLGPLALELIQILEGESTHAEFLREKGEGIHHLGFRVEDLDADVARLEKLGIGVLMTNREGKNGFAYMDTEPSIGYIVELIASPATSAAAQPSAQASNGAISLPPVGQIGIVVNDLEESIAKYERILGVGPFEVREMGVPAMIFRGDPRPVKARLGFFNSGPVQLELIHITEGETTHTEYLREKGECLHHLGFRVEDLDADLAQLAKENVQVLMTNRTGKSGFAYMDTTEVGGMIFELIQRPSV